MLKLIRKMRRSDVLMALVCSVLVLGQIYFDLELPDYMSDLTVLIETPGSTMSDILHTGLEMLGCTLASAALCILCGYLTAKVAAGFALTTRERVFNKIADFGQQEMMSFSVPVTMANKALPPSGRPLLPAHRRRCPHRFAKRIAHRSREAKTLFI